MLKELGIDYHELEPGPYEMGFVGDEAVLKNILLKNHTPHRLDIRTALILPGGAQRGIYQVGVGVALYNLDLLNGIDYCVGGSAGAIAAAYIASRDIVVGKDIAWTDAKDERVYSLKRPREFLSMDSSERVLRGSKAINIDNIKNSSTQAFASLTNYETGEISFAHLNQMTDPIEYLLGSMSHVLYNGNRPRTIDGDSYSDGHIGCPFPIEFAAQQLRCTDILIVSTSPLHEKKLPSEREKQTLNSFFKSRGLPQAMIDVLNNYNATYNSQLEYLTGKKKLPSVRIATIYPTTNKVKKNTTNPDVLRNAAFESYAFAIKKFLGLVY